MGERLSRLDHPSQARGVLCRDATGSAEDPTSLASRIYPRARAGSGVRGALLPAVLSCNLVVGNNGLRTLQTFTRGLELPAKSKNGRGGARSGSGPKPRPAKEHRRNRVMLNFTDDELAALEAASGGESTSFFTRGIVLRYLARRRN